MHTRTLHIPAEWREAAEEVATHGGPVMVIGAPGSGKTTFCQYLTGFVCRSGGAVAWIDADPGQPFIGPPAIFSLSIYREASELPTRKIPAGMAFIGNTSPVGHLLEAVTSLQKLVLRAREFSPSLILINGCGLTAGSAARALTFHEIEIVEPRSIVAIQAKGEVEHLLAPHTHRAGLLFHRIPLSPDARTPTREARQAAREQRFKEYFRGADFQELALSDVGIHGPGLGTGERLGFRDVNYLSQTLQAIVIHAELSSDKIFLLTEGDYQEEELYTARERYGVREISVFKKAELDHLLVGLNDDQNYCIALGILRDLDMREQLMRVITPLRDLAPVRHLSLGSLRVSPTGSELGRW